MSARASVAVSRFFSISRRQYHHVNHQPLRVLVTGGSSGIGRAIAEKFASNNHYVLSVDIDEAANGSLQSEYSNIESLTKDVTLEEAPMECVKRMVTKWNGVDVLINNAAVQFNGIPIHELEESLWDRTMAVNLTAYYRFSKYVIQQILRQPKADLTHTRYHIVNMSSIQGMQSQCGVAAYCASKAAIIALTRNMALEYAPLIRVNSISPGTILTPLHKKNSKEYGMSLQQCAEKYPCKRMGEPEEIANMVYFLCTEKCGFLTGQNIVIDGGITGQGGWHEQRKNNPYIDASYLKKYDD